MCGGCDNIRMVKGSWYDFAGNEAADVGHVRQQDGVHIVTDTTEPEINIYLKSFVVLFIVLSNH